jgi:2',3'-cyclic-nucleotide 2'-phosphodiesterase (5'-nucleotidase family)
MRRAIRLLPSAILFLACATVPPQQQPARFKILQINDVYKIEGLEGGNSGGLARVAALRRHLASDGTPVLVLHAGDALYPSVMSKYLEAKPMVDVLNLLDGNATATDPNLIITLGNHELDNKTPDILLARLGDSAFQWVATNTMRCSAPDVCNDRFPHVKPTILLDAGGTRVGVLGLLLPTKKNYAKADNVLGAARDAVAQLRRDGARVVIAITHQDMADDVKLVEQVPGVDLVIGGHDHLYVQDRVGTTWVAKADADAKSVIVYDVAVPPSGAIRTTPLRVLLDATMPKDPAVDARVQTWVGTLATKLGGNDTIGTTKNLLEGVEPAVRGRETALGNLLADVAREQMQTDVAVVNGGGIRINDNIPPGPITKYDMEGVFYFDNRLVATRVTGQQLLDMLRHSVERADAGDGRFLQVSGVTFTYRKRDGRWTVDPADVKVAKQPLDLARTYTLALTDYMYLHGSEVDKYVLFTDANRPPKVNTEREADFRKSVEAWIRARGTIDVAIDGRIIRGD